MCMCTCTYVLTPHLWGTLENVMEPSTALFLPLLWSRFPSLTVSFPFPQWCGSRAADAAPAASPSAPAALQHPPDRPEPFSYTGCSVAGPGRGLS